MNGIIVVDKPKNYTSRDVVNIISKKFKTKKVGHTGTLDPMASGVLVVCIGKALKVAELIVAYDKEYIAKVRLGYETDTLDSEGIIVKKHEFVNYTELDIRRVLNNFVGDIEQEVPMYSAVKVNGKKLYEYARNNIEVKIPVHKVTVNAIELISDIEIVDGYIEFSIKCDVSKGTYIRSLVRDIGVSLGTYATMVELRRIRQGKFEIDSAYTLDNINDDHYKILSIDEVINMDKIVVPLDMEFKIKNGQKIDYNISCDRVMIMDSHNKLLAIYQKDGKGKIKPWKVLG